MFDIVTHTQKVRMVHRMFHLKVLICANVLAAICDSSTVFGTVVCLNCLYYIPILTLDGPNVGRVNGLAHT